MNVGAFLGNLGTEILGELSASGLVRMAVVGAQGLRRIAEARLALVAPVRGHERQLRMQVRDMPFIYRGLDDAAHQIMSDYVNVKVERLNVDSFKVVATGTRAPLAQSERLRRARKVLLLGNAGIGKTTLERFAVLCLLSGDDKRDFVYPGERLVPFYVPLKVVDNTERFPILRHILSTSFSGGAKAKATLERLATKRRVFLFLDGYDEIMQVGGAAGNHVQEELELLVHGRSARLYRQLDADAQAIYGLLSECRTWISSRIEFYERNPIRRSAAAAPNPLNEPDAFKLLGLGESERVRLVANIFSRYDKGKLEGLLNPEYFVFQLDGLVDSELRELSFNPLFLTVLCFVYIKQVEEAQTPEVEWSGSLASVITRCVRLLLRDLDAEKARSLPPAQRYGLLTRRNAYFDEKIEFLGYLSASLYFTSQTVISLEFIAAKAVEFFTSVSQSPLRERIVAEVRDDSVHGLHWQLIFSGVLVLVERRRDGITLYDFPHRRFREVLASDYVQRPRAYVAFLGRLDEEPFRELEAVLARTPSFHGGELHLQALGLLFDMCLESGGDFRNESYHLARLLPRGLDIAPMVERFVLDCLVRDVPEFTLSAVLLDLIREKDRVAAECADVIRKASNDGRWRTVAFACSVLRTVNAPLFGEVLRSMGKSRPNPDVGLVLLKERSRVVALSAIVRDVLALARMSPVHLASFLASDFPSLAGAESLGRVVRKEGGADAADLAVLIAGQAGEQELGRLNEVLGTAISLDTIAAAEVVGRGGSTNLNANENYVVLTAEALARGIAVIRGLRSPGHLVLRRGETTKGYVVFMTGDELASRLTAVFAPFRNAIHKDAVGAGQIESVLSHWEQRLPVKEKLSVSDRAIVGGAEYSLEDVRRRIGAAILAGAHAGGADLLRLASALPRVAHVPRVSEFFVRR